jgi:16S rRNA (guanine527-N7)-methyltransferase
MAHKNDKNYSPYKERQKEGPRTRLGTHKKPEAVYPVSEANDRLADIFRNHDFDLVSHQQRQQLAQFYSLLMNHQKNENFTRLLRFRDIAIKHFIDSLIILKHDPLVFPLVDMGTGPGFPGIPLKIMRPDQKIILAEGVQKRVEFLKFVRDEMKLTQLEIIGRNVDETFVYPVQGVITRAVEDISNTLRRVQYSVQLGGKVFFMKGPGVDPEIKTALNDWSEFYKLDKDVAYSLPKTPHERRLVIFQKIKNTPMNEDED